MEAQESAKTKLAEKLDDGFQPKAAPMQFQKSRTPGGLNTVA
jgi:hypothetical protein